MTRIAYILALAAALAVAGPGLVGAAGTPDASAVAPSSQPAQATALPATRPEGSQVTSLLTGHLPPHLREGHLLAMRDLTPRETQLVGLRLILRDSQKTIEQIVSQKREFDQMPPEAQARYRERAALIEQVLNSLSPTEQSKLLALTPKERAKRIMELAAQLKAKQLRDGVTPPSGSPTSPTPPTTPK